MKPQQPRCLNPTRADLPMTTFHSRLSANARIGLRNGRIQMATEKNNPPFDGKPCPMCPMEIRNLQAVAHNAVGSWERGETERFARKMAELKIAVEKSQPLADAHFANRKHSHGE